VDRSLRESPTPKAGCSTLSCRHFTPYVRKFFCAEGDSYLRVASGLFG
jgi:hypothetical protein